MIKTTIHGLLRGARRGLDIAQALRNDASRGRGSPVSHQDYTRFIILGRSRSGSNFLRGLLNSHRHVVAFGELFQHDREISWGLSAYPQTPKLLAQFRNEPVPFLESHIFGPAPKMIHAVGFKIFYYHAHTAQWQPLWEYLKAQTHLKVIHIKRDNLLKVHLSRKRALMTDRWVNVTGAREQYPPIALDYNECLEDFCQTRRWESEYTALFSNHPTLEVHYEALAEDPKGEMERVQRFLDIQLEPLTPETHQQSDQALPLAIVNYHALKERFSGTEWQAFFEV